MSGTENRFKVKAVPSSKRPALAPPIHNAEKPSEPEDQDKESYRSVYEIRRRDAKDLEQAFQDGTSPSKTGGSVGFSKAIFVIRHGKTALDPIHRSDGWLDFPLSDVGRTRLITAQQYLKDVPIKHIYAPSLKRTQETAEILQSGMISHPNVISSDESKTWNLGLLAGTPKKPNKPTVQWYMKHPEEKPEGGESRNDFKDRFLSWLSDRKKETVQKGGPILLVLSGSSIREISALLTGDEDTLDLDEGGLLVMRPVKDGWTASVVFGKKNQDDEYLS